MTRMLAEVPEMWFIFFFCPFCFYCSGKMNSTDLYSSSPHSSHSCSTTEPIKQVLSISTNLHQVFLVFFNTSIFSPRFSAFSCILREFFVEAFCDSCLKIFVR